MPCCADDCWLQRELKYIVCLVWARLLPIFVLHFSDFFFKSRNAHRSYLSVDLQSHSESLCVGPCCMATQGIVPAVDSTARPTAGCCSERQSAAPPRDSVLSCAAVNAATSLPSWQVGWRNWIDRKLVLVVGRSVDGASLFLFSHIRNPAQLTAALYGYESLPVSLRIWENSRYLVFTERQMQIFFLPHSLTNSFIILSLVKFFFWNVLFSCHQVFEVF